MDALAVLLGLLSIAALVAIVAIAITLEMWRRASSRRFGHEVGERYRSLLRELPLPELLLDDAELDAERATVLAAEDLNVLYRYFDLCQEQVFLRSVNAIDEKTWQQWHGGIRRNFGHPVVRAGWSIVQARERGAFAELATLLAGNFVVDDPRRPMQTGGGTTPAAETSAR